MVAGRYAVATANLQCCKAGEAREAFSEGRENIST
jgi:hypothetical protein